MPSAVANIRGCDAIERPSCRLAQLTLAVVDGAVCAGRMGTWFAGPCKRVDAKSKAARIAARGVEVALLAACHCAWDACGLWPDAKGLLSKLGGT